MQKYIKQLGYLQPSAAETQYTNNIRVSELESLFIITVWLLYNRVKNDLNQI